MLSKKNKEKFYLNLMIQACKLTYLIYRATSFTRSCGYELPDKRIWIRHVTKMSETKGLMFTVLYWKQVRNFVYRYISGEPLLVKGLGVRTTVDGIPTCLQDWIPILRNDSSSPHIRVLTTLLSLGRLYDSIGKLDTSTIEAPYTGKPTSDVITDSDIGYFMDSYELSLYYKLKKKDGSPLLHHGDVEYCLSPHLYGDLYIRSTNGPMGPAMTSIIHEASALNPLQERAILNLLDDDGHTWLKLIRENVEEFLDHPAFSKTKREPSTRRVTVVKDKEGKNRVIAILDYWTQASLRKIHDYLSGILTSIPGDCTYDQTKYAKEFYLNHLGKGQHFSCLDLTAATDRMPMDLQERLLAGLLCSEGTASYVRYLLTGVPFNSEKGAIRYRVGQPMGAYTSWPLMALTHHLIVYKAALLAKRSARGSYLLLGDDIVIYDDEIAECYRVVLSDLGMEISSQKTMVSKHTMEFAKRLYHKGEDITPLSLGHMKYASKHIGFAADLLYESNRRGWNISEREAIDIFGTFFHGNGKFSDWWKRKLKLYLRFPLRRVEEDGVELIQAVKDWIGLHNFNVGCFSNREELYQDKFIDATISAYDDLFTGEVEHLFDQRARLLAYSNKSIFHPDGEESRANVFIYDIYNKFYESLDKEYSMLLSRIRVCDFKAIKQYKNIGRAMSLTDNLKPSNHQKSLLIKAHLYNKVRNIILTGERLRLTYLVD